MFAIGAYAADTGKVAVTLKGYAKNRVDVQLSGGLPETTSQVKRTGTSGKVTFSSLEPGSYTVTVRKSGVKFSPAAKIVTVIAGKSTRVSINSSQSQRTVGTAYCVNCHSRYASAVYPDWLASPHGNFQYVDANHTKFGYEDFLSQFVYPTDHTKFIGFPNSTTVGTQAKYCITCHGPSTRDNADVAKFPLVHPDGWVDTGNKTQAARYIVGCEQCHGGGSRHIAAPTSRKPTKAQPAAVDCGRCHNKDFPSNHLQYHPVGAAGRNNPGIYEAYQASAHTQSLNESVYADSKRQTVTALCAKCHSDTGARLYSGIQGDKTALENALSTSAAHTEFAPVQCRTCHEAHDPTRLLRTASAATSTATARSAEFNTCTSCHQLLDANDAKITPYHDTHAASITNTHYDSPATGVGSTENVAKAFEGYNVMRGSETACSNCHNPHITDLSINKQWAESAHGELDGEGWIHYDWKSSGRSSCQKCHTPIGFTNFVANTSTYNAANNNFSHLTGGQNDVLTCNGCHTDSSFARRPLSSVPMPSGLSIDIGGDSNLCMVCHGGRSSRVQVDAEIAKAGADSFQNIHYLAAAATLFGTDAKGGYEYDGKTYVGRNYFSQAHIDNNKTTCINCHMQNGSVQDDHRFVPQISVCQTCHTTMTSFEVYRAPGVADLDGDGDTSEGLKGEIDSLRDRLLVAIRAKGQALGTCIQYDFNTSPYWFKDNGKGGSTACDGVLSSSEKSSNSYTFADAAHHKAAYNYHLTLREPHGYIHNYRYFAELLYDSLEDLGGSAAVVGLTRP